MANGPPVKAYCLRQINQSSSRHKLSGEPLIKTLSSCQRPKISFAYREIHISRPQLWIVTGS